LFVFFLFFFYCFLAVGPGAVGAEETAQPAASSAGLSPVVSAATGDSYRVLWQRGEYSRACQVLGDALSQNAGQVPLEWWGDYADLLFAVGRVDEAIEHGEDVAASYPLPSVNLRLVKLYRYRGRWGEADEMLDRALRLRRYLRRFRLDAAEEVALGQLMQLRGEDPQALLEYYAYLAERYPGNAVVKTAAGDLAFGRRAWDVAARHYGQAAKLDPVSQAALAGLASTYHESGDPRLGQVLARLDSLNPHHPQARLLRVRRHLDLGRTAVALAQLDTLLQINPVHLEALGLKAAALFLADRLDESQAVQRLALDFNPFDSIVLRLAGQVASRRYRFAEGLRFQRLALAVDESDNEARLALALDLLRLGRDAEARQQLQRVFAADPYRVEAYNLLGVAEAMDSFRVLERGLFALKMPALEAQVLGEEMLDLLETAAGLYQKEYRVDLEGPVAVHVFDDHDEFMVRSVGLPGNAGHLGICFGRVVTMDSPRARPPGAMDWRQVLWHEFVHVITLEKTGNRLPRWLSEGISVFEEKRRDPAWGQPLEAGFAAVIEGDAFPAVAELEGYFTGPSSPAHLMFGYFAAGEFTDFYVEAYGQEILVRALEAIATGQDAVAALIEAAQQEEAVMDRLFQNHLRRRCAPLQLLAEDSVFSQALARGAKAAEAGQSQEAEDAYLEAYALWPEYDAQDAPLRQILRLHQEGDRVGTGNDSEADTDATGTDKIKGANAPTLAYKRALQRLVAWDAKAYNERVELASMSPADEAALLLAAAVAVAPFNPALQGKWAAALLETGGDAARPLGSLVHLDPSRSDGHRLTLARFLARDDAQGAKAAVLDLLEEKPQYRAAQELLLELVDGQGADSEEEDAD
jgi:tetratricopeptide (TPR) repeat protein